MIFDNSVIMGNPYKLVRSFNEKDDEMLKVLLSVMCLYPKTI